MTKQAGEETLPVYNLAHGIFWEIDKELARARVALPASASGHEGWAVIKEEMDELWEAVKHGGKSPGRIRTMRAEAIQVAAMAVRFVLDITSRDEIP